MNLSDAVTRLEELSANAPCPQCARRARLRRRVHTIACEVVYATLITLGLLAVVLLALFVFLAAAWDFSSGFG